MSQVAMIVKTKTQPGKRDEMFRLYEQQLAPRALSNDAQPVVVWCADTSDTDTFFLFEIYRDEASQQANAHAPWFFEYLTQAMPLLDGMPEVMTGTPHWAKGV